MNDLIIIGGGPAGLTAAVYAIRKRLEVLLLYKDLGGKTNYRLALPWIGQGLDACPVFSQRWRKFDHNLRVGP